MTTQRTERTGTEKTAERERQREQLLVQHRAARVQRDGAALGSDDFRAAAEEIARIEVQINRLEEPDPAD